MPKSAGFGTTVAAEGHRARLRERYVRAGAGAFAEHELLELLLTFAIPRKDTKPIAKRLLATFGSLHEVLNAPLERLGTVEGIGRHSAVLIRLIRDFHKPSVTVPNRAGRLIASTPAAAEILRGELASASEEQFAALLLDVSSRLLRVVLLAEGTIDRATVYPRRLVEECIQSGAAAVIVGHNHPRGGTEPTFADRTLTRQLFHAFSPLGVDLLDHVILGEGEYYSFARAGEIEKIKQAYVGAVHPG